MHSMLFPLLVLTVPRLASAALAVPFVKPAPCPTCSSPNYVGPNNGTLGRGEFVPGKAFGRFIQIWLENTDFHVAASNPTFKDLAKNGVLLTNYLALTHPSEPNYVASISGDFYGLSDDNYYNIPENITTIVDLLVQKGVSWATYQENLPTIAWAPDFTQTNYVSGNGTYKYYVRKHNPLVIHDAIANTSQAAFIRNFNDFAADVTADVLPQWMFITPNLVNDGHDTTIDYISSWLKYWLYPLLQDERFNSGEDEDGTLILLTFDENETYNTRNAVASLLLGSAVPKHLRGTTDTTLYSHYSTLSTVEGNWELGNLGRGDVNATLGNVFGFVADKIGFKNTHTPIASEPQTNLTGVFPGALSSSWIPFTAPNKNSTLFGGTKVRPGNNWNINSNTVGAPITLPYAGIPAAGLGGIIYSPPLPGQSPGCLTTYTGAGKARIRDPRGSDPCVAE